VAFRPVDEHRRHAQGIRLAAQGQRALGGRLAVVVVDDRQAHPVAAAVFVVVVCHCPPAHAAAAVAEVPQPGADRPVRVAGVAGVEAHGQRRVARFTGYGEAGHRRPVGGIDEGRDLRRRQGRRVDPQIVGQARAVAAKSVVKVPAGRIGVTAHRQDGRWRNCRAVRQRAISRRRAVQVAGHPPGGPVDDHRRMAPHTRPVQRRDYLRHAPAIVA